MMPDPWACNKYVKVHERYMMEWTCTDMQRYEKDTLSERCPSFYEIDNWHYFLHNEGKRRIELFEIWKVSEKGAIG